MTISEIEVGQTATLSKQFTQKDLEAFALLSGDYNPLHMDGEFTRLTSFQRPVVHGMLLSSYVSTLVGMRLPGPGSLWTQQKFRWLAPVFVGDTIEVTLKVTRKSAGAGAVNVEVLAVNQEGRTVMDGEGVVTMVHQRRDGTSEPVAERVALVTGSSRGIGAAVALELARAGYLLAVNYLNRREQAEGICRQIEEEGGKAFLVQADLKAPDEIAMGVDRIAERFGRPVDILVNNASAQPVLKPFGELAWADIQALIDVQVRGAYECAQAVLPGMVQQKWGRIVNIGSSLIRTAPTPGWTAFAVAKSALHALTRSLAVEFGPHGILVNTVSPGMTETESLSVVPERLRKVEAMRSPLRRLSSPEDVARTVAFLCSEGANAITGADVPVSGGSSM